MNTFVTHTHRCRIDSNTRHQLLPIFQDPDTSPIVVDIIGP